MTRNIFAFFVTFATSFIAITPAYAGPYTGDLLPQCVPYAPSQCKCWTNPGESHPHCIVLRPPVPPSTCGQCLNGCGENGECISGPYTDEDGFPICATDDCAVIEIDEYIVGTCTDYEWICDDRWCRDTADIYWRRKSFR